MFCRGDRLESVVCLSSMYLYPYVFCQGEELLQCAPSRSTPRHEVDFAGDIEA